MCSLRQSKLNTMRIKLTLPWLSKKVNDSFLCNRRPRFTSSSSPTSSTRSKRWPWRGRSSWRSQSPWRGTLTLSHHCNIGRVLSAQATLEWWEPESEVPLPQTKALLSQFIFIRVNWKCGSWKEGWVILTTVDSKWERLVLQCWELN